MPASPGKRSGVDERARATKVLIWRKGQVQLRQRERADLRRLADELGDLPRPEGAAWAGFTFSEAVRDPVHGPAARSWMSKIIHQAKPPV